MEYFDGITTPIGRLHIVVSDSALLHIYFPNEKWSQQYIRSATHPLVIATKKQLREYFSGKRKKFNLPLCAHGTAFQKKAWSALQKIPYGETISYTEEAKSAGSPSAVRAIGTANSRNPLPIIVPCHRVVAKGGKLGGYSGGLVIKKKLLALESAHRHP